MDNPMLEGVWHKIARADKHFLELDSAVKALGSTNDTPQTPLYTYSQGHELIVKSPKPKPLDPIMPLVIGDYIHNLRSALDHLVFQLALLNGSGEQSAKKTAFPIYLTAKKFNNFCDRFVAPYIGGEALAEIATLQPYATGNAGEEDILWVLSQLDIIDKHRVLVVLVQQFRPVHFVVSVPGGETLEVDIADSEWKPLEDGAEIIRFNLSKAIKHPGKVKVKLKTAKTVKLAKTGLICDEFDLGIVLDDCRKVVVRIVDSFGKRFFGE